MANINISDLNPIDSKILFELSTEEEAAIIGGGLWDRIKTAGKYVGKKLWKHRGTVGPIALGVAKRYL